MLDQQSELLVSINRIDPTEYRALYEGILNHMVEAGWIERFTCTPKSGITIRWTDLGTRRASVLKEIVRMHDLNGGPGTARLFDIHACKLNRKKFTPDADTDRKIAYFWRTCMKELKFHRDDIDFLGLTHVIAEFAPDLPGGTSKPPNRLNSP